MGRRKSSKDKQQTGNKGAKTATRSPVPDCHQPPLHQADAELWAQVTKSLTPLKDQHDRLHFGPLLDEKPVGRRRQPSDTFVPPSPKPAGRVQQVSPPNSRISSRAEVGFIQFSRREMRQIDSGRQSIEDRLDLHGLHQSAAHRALKNFIQQSQANGLRHVLVITGKGRTLGPAERDYMNAGYEPGILRRMVPLWFGEMDLRNYIAGYTQAPRRHGGEGALYVRLRRKR